MHAGPGLAPEANPPGPGLLFDPRQPVAAGLPVHSPMLAMTGASLNADSIFLEAPFYNSGGYKAVSVAIGDVNGDGRADLVVANQCQSSSNCNGVVSVLLGNGDGTFQAPVSYSSGGYEATSVAIGDVNGDGHADLVVANQCQSSSNCNGAVSVLLGNGDGTFQAPVSYSSGGYYALSVAVGDVNGDGRADLVVANWYQSNGINGSLGVLLGNGDGTFQSPVSYSSGGLYAYSVAIGDVNGDGHADLVVANECQSNGDCSSGAVSVLLGNGDGTFQSAASYSAGYDAYSVAIGDVNGDGHADLVVANQCQSSSNCNGAVSVLLGNGDGTFQAPVSYSSGGNDALSVAIGDVNGDGHADLVVANECQSNGDCSSGAVSVLLGNGDGTFQAPVSYRSGGSEATSVAIGDVNGDGHADLVVANQCNSDCSSGAVSVLLGNGDGTFQAPVSYSSGGYDALSVAIGDVNGDGHADLAVANWAGVSVLLGNGDGSFQAAINTTIPVFGFGGLALADFNGDGKLDVASGAGDFLLLGNGDGTFQSPLILGSGGAGVVAGDFNGDGRADLAAGGVTVLLNVATGFRYATTTAVASSANPANGPVTFTATVTPGFNTGALTGSVTFYDGANSLGSAPVSNGQAVLANVSLTPGEHSITATYSGDTNYLPSTSLVLNETENSSASTTTTLASSVNPSSFNQFVSFTATVTASGGGTPTGSVTFLDGATALATIQLSNGAAIFATSALVVGTHSITASYSGDSNFNASSSSPLLQVVKAQPVTVALGSSLNPSVYGQPVSLTATITPQYGGTATGTVTFYDSGTVLGSSAVSGNAASLIVNSLTAGAHSLAASYSGDSNNGAATSSPLVQTVNKATSTAALVSSPNPSVYGQPVTLTATIAPQYEGTATGTVTFYDSGTVLGSSAVSGNAAALTVNSLSVGTHSLKAIYSGDDNVTGSSAGLSQTVNRAATATALVSSQNPAYIAQLVTFTITVAPQFSGTPTGKAILYRGAAKLATLTLSNGEAAYSTAALPLGTSKLKAIYQGDSNFNASTSPVLKEVITKVPTTVTLSSSVNPSQVEQPVTFTAAVSSPLGSPPDGELITFKDGSATIGTRPLSGGVAAFTTSALAKGTHTIRAYYPGDSEFTASHSAALKQVVK